MPRLYDVVDSAERLSVSPWTIRAKIREGLIRPVRIGRRVLIEERELERVISEGRQVPCADYGADLCLGGKR